jgi:hypothetical protein
MITVTALLNEVYTLPKKASPKGDALNNIAQ